MKKIYIGYSDFTNTLYAYSKKDFSDKQDLSEQFAAIVRKVCKLNNTKEIEIEDNKQGYQSVKDALPPSDGIFYDVMGILWNDNISGGYNYYRGQYQNGFFFFEHSMYLQKEDFRNSNTQKKVIAWKPLLKCTSDQITEFCEKQGVL